MAETQHTYRDDNSSGDALTAVIRRWWAVLLFAFIGGTIGFLMSRTLLAVTYESQGTIFVQQAAPLAGALRDLPSAVTGKPADPAGYLITVLQSDTMARRVAASLDLKNRSDFYDGGKYADEIVQRNLKRCVSVRQDKNGAVVVAARTGDPELCAKIVDLMLKNLGDLFQTQSMRREKFIQNKLKDTNSRLKQAEEEMLAFQNKNNVAMIDEQTKTVVRELGELDGNLLSQTIELEQVKIELANGGDIEDLVKLRVRRKALDNSRNLIAQRIDNVRRQLANAPLMSLEYARLQRNIAMLSKTADLLTEQSELAAISLHGDEGEYRVVDWAQAKYEPVGPRNAVNAAVGAALLALLAMAVAATIPPPRRRFRPTSSLPPEQGGALA